MADAPTSGLLSVVLPSYNEERSIPRAVRTIREILAGADIPFELIFVDDGSKDRTWAVLQEQSAQCPQVRGVRFSRNFGKEAAIFAGLAQSKGACTAVMDCDLQHPPEKLVEMYRLWQRGAQVVEGIKVSRGRENPLHTFAARRFYDLISRATGIDMSRASDFKLLDRRAVDTLLALREKNAFFRALSSWIGFSTAPLQLVTALGVVVFLCSVVLGIHSLWQKFTGHALEGFTTVILLQLLLGSILMICLGIIGYYISKIYEEIKDRPRYIVADRCGGPAHDGQAEKTV